MAFITLNAAVFAPMPSASVTVATTANIGVRRSWRSPKRMSWSMPLRRLRARRGCPSRGTDAAGRYSSRGEASAAGVSVARTRVTMARIFGS